MENPIKIYDLGVPLFLETPMYIYISLSLSLSLSLYIYIGIAKKGLYYPITQSLIFIMSLEKRTNDCNNKLLLSHEWQQLVYNHLLVEQLPVGLTIIIAWVNRIILINPTWWFILLIARTVRLRRSAWYAPACLEAAASVGMPSIDKDTFVMLRYRYCA